MAAPVTITLILDSSNLDRSLVALKKQLDSLVRTSAKTNKSVSSIENTVKKTSQSVSAFSKNWRTLYYDIRRTSTVMSGFFASGYILRGFKTLINAAADAQETYAKFDVVFKNSMDIANKSFKELTTNYRLAHSTAKKMLADTGNLLYGFGIPEREAARMSAQIQKMASDLAYFSNYAGRAEGASVALTKAIYGRREMAKRLGLAITENAVKERMAALVMAGYAQSTEKATKALATIQIMQEQATKAFGSTARESKHFMAQVDRLKAAFRDLAEKIGGSMLEAATNAVKGLTAIVRSVESLPPALLATASYTTLAATGLVGVGSAAMAVSVLWNTLCLTLGRAASVTGEESEATTANTAAVKQNEAAITEKIAADNAETASINAKTAALNQETAARTANAKAANETFEKLKESGSGGPKKIRKRKYTSEQYKKDIEEADSKRVYQYKAAAASKGKLREARNRKLTAIDQEAAEQSDKVQRVPAYKASDDIYKKGIEGHLAKSKQDTTYSGAVENANKAYTTRVGVAERGYQSMIKKLDENESKERKKLNDAKRSLKEEIKNINGKEKAELSKVKKSRKYQDLKRKLAKADAKARKDKDAGVSGDAALEASLIRDQMENELAPTREKYKQKRLAAGRGAKPKVEAAKEKLAQVQSDNETKKAEALKTKNDALAESDQRRVKAINDAETRRDMRKGKIADKTQKEIEALKDKERDEAKKRTDELDRIEKTRVSKRAKVENDYVNDTIANNSDRHKKAEKEHEVRKENVRKKARPVIDEGKAERRERVIQQREERRYENAERRKQEERKRRLRENLARNKMRSNEYQPKTYNADDIRKKIDEARKKELDILLAQKKGKPLPVEEMARVNEKYRRALGQELSETGTLRTKDERRYEKHRQKQERKHYKDLETFKTPKEERKEQRAAEKARRKVQKAADKVKRANKKTRRKERFAKMSFTERGEYRAKKTSHRAARLRSKTPKFSSLGTKKAWKFSNALMLTPVFGQIKKMLMPVFGLIGKMFVPLMPVFKALSPYLKIFCSYFGMIGNVFKAVIVRLVPFVGWVTLIGTAIYGLGQLFKRLPTWFEMFLEKVWPKIKDWSAKAIKAAPQVAMTIVKGLMDAIRYMWQGVTQIWGRIFGFRTDAQTEYERKKLDDARIKSADTIAALKDAETLLMAAREESFNKVRVLTQSLATEINKLTSGSSAEKTYIEEREKSKSMRLQLEGLRKAEFTGSEGEELSEEQQKVLEDAKRSGGDYGVIIAEKQAQLKQKQTEQQELHKNVTGASLEINELSAAWKAAIQTANMKGEKVKEGDMITTASGQTLTRADLEARLDELNATRIKLEPQLAKAEEEADAFTRDLATLRAVSSRQQEIMQLENDLAVQEYVERQAEIDAENASRTRDAELTYFENIQKSANPLSDKRIKDELTDATLGARVGNAERHSEKYFQLTAQNKDIEKDLAFVEYLRNEVSASFVPLFQEANEYGQQKEKEIQEAKDKKEKDKLTAELEANKLYIESLRTQQQQSMEQIERNPALMFPGMSNEERRGLLANNLSEIGAIPVQDILQLPELTQQYKQEKTETSTKLIETIDKLRDMATNVPATRREKMDRLLVEANERQERFDKATTTEEQIKANEDLIATRDKIKSMNDEKREDRVWNATAAAVTKGSTEAAQLENRIFLSYQKRMENLATEQVTIQKQIAANTSKITSGWLDNNFNIVIAK